MVSKHEDIQKENTFVWLSFLIKLIVGLVFIPNINFEHFPTLFSFMFLNDNKFKKMLPRSESWKAKLFILLIFVTKSCGRIL